VIEWLPTARLEVETDAWPPLTATVPNAVPPSLKVTVPVAAEGETVAVKVTDWPYGEEEVLDDTLVLVPAMATAYASGAEALPPNAESPPYVAVIEREPPESVEVANVALPLVSSVPVPRFVPPSLNVTVPVGVPVPLVCATVAVKVTEFPYVEEVGVAESVVVVGTRLCPQPMNLKEPMKVAQLNVPLLDWYWFVYQKVQSSVGSMRRAV
jgi:hypothetical protein